MIKILETIDTLNKQLSSSSLWDAYEYNVQFEFSSPSQVLIEMSVKIKRGGLEPIQFGESVQQIKDEITNIMKLDGYYTTVLFTGMSSHRGYQKILSDVKDIYDIVSDGVSNAYTQYKRRNNTNQPDNDEQTRNR